MTSLTNENVILLLLNLGLLTCVYRDSLTFGDDLRWQFLKLQLLLFGFTFLSKKLLLDWDLINSPTKWQIFVLYLVLSHFFQLVIS